MGILDGVNDKLREAAFDLVRRSGIPQMVAPLMDKKGTNPFSQQSSYRDLKPASIFDTNPPEVVLNGVDKKKPAQVASTSQVQGTANAVPRSISTSLVDRLQAANAEWEKRFSTPGGGGLFEVIRGSNRSYIDFNKSPQEFASPAEAIMGLSGGQIKDSAEAESKTAYATMSKADAVAKLGENARENKALNVALPLALDSRRQTEKAKKAMTDEELMQLLLQMNNQ